MRNESKEPQRPEGDTARPFGRSLLLLCIFALSGASGLIYELVWVRLLSFLLGGTVYAIGFVLASFMAGLALGSGTLGRRADRSGDPLGLYARLEFVVALTGAAVPLLVLAAKPVYVALAHVLPPSALPVVRLALAFLLLLPPTFAMGGTLPVLCRCVARRNDHLGRDLGLLYGANTLGAMAGSFAAGFVLVPSLGLVGSTAVAVFGNLVAAGVALAIRAQERRMPATPMEAGHASPTATPAPASSTVSARGNPTPAAMAVLPRSQPAELGLLPLSFAFAASGFVALGLEVYWTRALQSFLGNTTYAFAAMLTTFLFGLAAGGWLGGRLADRVASPARVLGWVLLGIAFTSAATLPVVWELLPRLRNEAFFAAPGASWFNYLLRRFAAAFTIMAIPTLLAGAVFPLVNRIGIGNLARLGSGVGALYAANTVGAIAGALAAPWLVLPWVGLRAALLSASLLAAAVGLGVHLAHRHRSWRHALAATLACLLLAASSPELHRRASNMLDEGQDLRDTVLFEREDATAETRVYEKHDGRRQMRVNGQYIGGNTPLAVQKEKLLAHLPVALVPRAERVLAVGLGSGITLGTLALYDEVRDLVCVEIVPGVVDGAAYFRADHHDVLHDPRLRLAVGDGVQYLLTSTERFDVISSDSKLNPEYAGNGAILSREYYDLCRKHLTETGVMLQWLSVHIPLSTMQLVSRTFVDAFPYVELFWIEPSDVLMAGSRAPIAFDLERWQARLADSAVRADLEALQLGDAVLLATSHVAGRERLDQALAGAPRHTWGRPTYEFRVVRDVRRQGLGYHVKDNLRWLAGLWAPDFTVRGGGDDERLARFRDSSRQLLLGYAAGRGDEGLAAGRESFATGLARNPEDHRLVRLLERLELPPTTHRDDDPAAPGAAPE